MVSLTNQHGNETFGLSMMMMMTMVNIKLPYEGNTIFTLINPVYELFIEMFDYKVPSVCNSEMNHVCDNDKKRNFYKNKVPKQNKK